jgi:class 3 adenylate cyclase
LSSAGPLRTVTLLFTDIEGSTRLLREAGAEYGAVLDGHRAVIRDVVLANHGREIDSQGDSFFAVFDSARDGVGAAAAIQKALASPEWPFAHRVHVRIGLDTGEPTADGQYIGLVVHRAARICAAANGGQVMLSAATRSVLGVEAISGTALLDLGARALKDFDEAEHLFQLLIDGLPADLRAPRTGSAHVPEIAAAVERPRSPGRLTNVTHRLTTRRDDFSSLASDVFAVEGVAPDPELRAPLHELGMLLMTARERLRQVESYLSEHNASAMARDLKRRRAAAATLESAVRIDSLAEAVEALQGLARRDLALREGMRSCAHRVDEFRDALFEVRLGRGSRKDLLDRLGSACTEIEVLSNGVGAQLTIAARAEIRAAPEERHGLDAQSMDRSRLRTKTLYQQIREQFGLYRVHR